MAKTPISEIFSTLKTYINQLSEGERTPTEVASALNGWARESAESIKAKISEEVEATVSKMGFIKQEEYDLLLERVAKLEKSAAKKSSAKTPAKTPTRSSVKKTESKSVKKSTKKASK
jgi:BMFP domain-containing protein YqiC